jgi:hypothetical protein
VEDEREESTSCWSKRSSAPSTPYDLYLWTHGSESWPEPELKPYHPNHSIIVQIFI